MTTGDQVTVTTSICSGRKGVITGFLNKPVDSCTIWVHLDNMANSIGFRAKELSEC